MALDFKAGGAQIMWSRGLLASEETRYNHPESARRSSPSSHIPSNRVFECLCVRGDRKWLWTLPKRSKAPPAVK